jgi:hypothetical protein
MNTEEKRRIVTAPQQGGLDCSSPVINVVVGEDEEVRWQ